MSKKKQVFNLNTLLILGLLLFGFILIYSLNQGSFTFTRCVGDNKLGNFDITLDGYVASGGCSSKKTVEGFNGANLEVNLRFNIVGFHQEALLWSEFIKSQLGDGFVLHDGWREINTGQILPSKRWFIVEEGSQAQTDLINDFKINEGYELGRLISLGGKFQGYWQNEANRIGYDETVQNAYLVVMHDTFNYYFREEADFECQYSFNAKKFGEEVNRVVGVGNVVGRTCFTNINGSVFESWNPGTAEFKVAPSFTLDVVELEDKGVDVNIPLCISDVLQCGDGSYVSRNPELNCNFDVCPIGTEVLSEHDTDSLTPPDGVVDTEEEVSIALECGFLCKLRLFFINLFSF